VGVETVEAIPLASLNEPSAIWLLAGVSGHMPRMRELLSQMLKIYHHPSQGCVSSLTTPEDIMRHAWVSRVGMVMLVAIMVLAPFFALAVSSSAVATTYT
jgi:hypothetical protein